MASGIIPLREIIGNYNLTLLILSDYFNYTLERDNRELQLMVSFPSLSAYYTLERDNRELQPVYPAVPGDYHYTLERDNRELQHVTARIP